MKLQYNTVEINIQKLNEKIKQYNKAYKRNDFILCEQIVVELNRITMDLRGSIRNGDWYSKNLKILNGEPRKNPSKFYIEFNSIY